MPKGFESDDERATKPRPKTLTERDAVVHELASEDSAPREEQREITSPVELLCALIGDDELEAELEEARAVAERRGVDIQSPLTIQDGVRIIRRQSRQKRDSDQILDATRSKANQILEVAGTKTPSLDRLAAVEAELGAVRHKLKVAWIVISFVATAAGGSIVTVAKGLYGRGFDEGALKLQIQTLERDIERNRIEIRDLRRYRPRVDGALPTPPPKSLGAIKPSFLAPPFLDALDLKGISL